MADKVIALACAAGMSTSLLVSKMQKAAADNSRRDPKTDSEKSGGRKWRSDGQHSCRI